MSEKQWGAVGCMVATGLFFTLVLWLVGERSIELLAVVWGLLVLMFILPIMQADEPIKRSGRWDYPYLRSRRPDSSWRRRRR